MVATPFGDFEGGAGTALLRLSPPTPFGGVTAATLPVVATPFGDLKGEVGKALLRLSPPSPFGCTTAANLPVSPLLPCGLGIRPTETLRDPLSLSIVAIGDCDGLRFE